MNGISSRTNATTLGFIHPAVAIQQSIERRLNTAILLRRPTAILDATDVVINECVQRTEALFRGLRVTEVVVPELPIQMGGHKRDLRNIMADPWHKANREYQRSKKAQRYDKSRRDHLSAPIGVTEAQIAGADLFAVLMGVR